MRMRGSIPLLAAAVLAIAISARADAIQKWRTPDGSLYFGDRPPVGSTLLETIPDTPAQESITAPGIDSELSQAAAEGREIIRQREAVRAEERKADAERAERFEAASFEPDYGLPSYLFIDSFPRACAFGEPCVHGHHGHDFGNHDHGRHHHDGGAPSQVHQPRPQKPPRMIGMNGARLSGSGSSGSRKHPRGF